MITEAGVNRSVSDFEFTDDLSDETLDRLSVQNYCSGCSCVGG